MLAHVDTGLCIVIEHDLDAKLVILFSFWTGGHICLHIDNTLLNSLHVCVSSNFLVRCLRILACQVLLYAGKAQSSEDIFFIVPQVLFGRVKRFHPKKKYALSGKISQIDIKIINGQRIDFSIRKAAHMWYSVTRKAKSSKRLESLVSRFEKTAILKCKLQGYK